MLVITLASGVTLLVASRRRSEEHTSELQSRSDLVCRLLREKKKPPRRGHRVPRRRRCISGSSLPRGAATSAPWGAAVLPARFFFFNDTATTEIYTLSLHDALPI